MDSCAPIFVGGAAQPGESDTAVQQCYRLSSSLDLALIVRVADMSTYLVLSQRLSTRDANVRNVKAFFSIKRSKFDRKVLVAQ